MVPGPDKRFAFTVHYDGSAFFGWQLQREDPSVQGELERVLSRLLDRPTRVTGSGRTDRGVHAVGQVASVDAPARWTAAELRRAMNALLPVSVWVAHMAEVAPDFHPRFDAQARSYVYRIGTDRLAASPFLSRWCWQVRHPLDLDLMRDCARVLVGDHSFAAFAKAGQEERGDRCTVATAEWIDWEDLGVEFHITANRFLHHMVRYLVGTLVEVGARRRPPGDVAGLLEGEPTLQTSPPAPARGLFLASVRYPQGAYDPSDRRGDRGLPLPPPGHRARD